MFRKISERYASNNLRKLSKEYCAPSTHYQQKYIGGADLREGEESDLEPGLGQEETGAKEVRSDQSGASILTTDQSQAGTRTPEPTFENEPRYSQQPPGTPKRSPEKRSEPNPLLKLAVRLIG